MRRHAFAVAALFAALSLGSCDKARRTPPNPSGPGSCLGCHGGAAGDQTGAPPNDLAGSAIGGAIGAHTAHLGKLVACDDCHKVPGLIGDAGHMVKPDGTPDGDRRAEITWGARATHGGTFSASFSPAPAPGKGGSCTVYCHGASLGASGGSATTPAWGDPPMNCGSCHGDAVANPSSPNTTGAPPSHAAGLTPTDCATCHPDTVTPAGQLTTTGAHIDGQVQASGCTACHGDTTRGEPVGSQAAWAPPRDSRGQTTGPQVGAHLRHVSTVASLGSRISRPFECSECHRVPTNGGPHGQPVIQWATGTNDLVDLDGLSPSYAAGSCASTYCHGGSLAGGSNKTPAWNTPGAGACGSCHFISGPVAPHPVTDKSGLAITAATQCAQCHPGTVNADGTINTGNGLHVNGLPEFDYHPVGYSNPATHGPQALQGLAACATCHGSSFAGQGAAPSCTACHAAAGRPTWLTDCTFCHGAGNRAADAAFAAVGNPPVAANRAAPPEGTQGETGANQPAVGAHLAHIQPSSSLNPAGALAIQIQCTECHGAVLPGDEKHADGSVAIGWGSLARARSAVPTPAEGNLIAGWEANPTCTNYCHGITLAGGGAKVNPNWVAGAPEAACGTCHAARPGTWHPNNGACGQCHPGYSASGVNALTHVNGLIDPAGTNCTSCHGGPSGNPAPPYATTGASSGVKVGAHQPHTAGGTLVAAGYGCGTCHTGPASLRHGNDQVDMAWTAPATAGGVTPAPLAGALPVAAWEAAPTCTNYCHGASLTAAGGTNKTPSWTAGAGQVACGTCHGAPPPLAASPAGANHPQNPVCASCHGAGYAVAGISGTARTTHVDTLVTLVVSGCTSCHGDRAVAGVTLGNGLAASAPSGGNQLDTTGQGLVSAPGVGAHAAHASGTTYRSAALACTECHALPPTNADRAHATGAGTGGARATLAWGNLALGTPASWNNEAVAPSYAGSTSAAYGTTAGSCASTYCHGQFKNGGKATVAWTSTGGLTCNSCHGAGTGPTATLPGGSHPQGSTACGSCHGAGYGGTAVDKATHLDGLVQVSTLSCSSCHGDPARAPVLTAAELDANGAPLVQASPPAGVTTANQVGAHLAHVNQGATPPALSSAVRCDACHLIPLAGAHSNGSVLVTFGGLATNGASPTYDPVARGCSATYCHGQFTGGLQGNTVGWNAAGKLACNACHGQATAAQPPHPHPQNLACATCHAGYTSSAVTAATHVDGTVNKTTSGCTSCHGQLSATGVTVTPPANLAAAAPGATGTNALGTMDTVGQTAATSAGVGAHRAHLGAGVIGRVAIACGECHALPSGNTDTAHATGGAGTGGARATLAWSTTATGAVNAWSGAPVNPSYTGSASFAGGTAGGSCASTYCHGNFRNGKNATVGWTTVGPLTCNSCHGAAAATVAIASLPGGTHPQGNTDCSVCHAGYTTTTASAALHLNGRLDAAADTCTGCHGNLARASVATATDLDVFNQPLQQSAPPIDLSGLASGNQVGAHLAHVNQGATGAPLSAAQRCVACHVVPSSTTHSDGVTTVTFGDIAVAAGAAYAPATLSCSSTYCHGQFAGGIPSNVVAWGTGPTAATKLACNACHGQSVAAPQPGYPHPQNATCVTCHAGYSASSVTASTHVDGAVNRGTFGCSGCHGVLSTPSPGVLAATPLNSAPGAGGTGLSTTGGPVAATTNEYGAHQAHLQQTTYRSAAIACADCHLVPADGNTAHAVGVGTGGARATLTWSALARGAVNTIWSPAVTPTYSRAGGVGCTATYCHGNFTNGKGPAFTVGWAQDAALTCNSCHGAGAGATATLPGGTHPQSSTDCGRCHSGYTGTTVSATNHINGQLDLVPMTCTTCHGDVARTPVATAVWNDVNGQNLVRAAPPVDASGTAGGNLVGAHQAHVNQGDAAAPGPLSNALRCDNCHLGQVWTTAPHATPANPVLWGNIATAGGITPTAYSAASKTCSNTYCHGNFPGGKLANTVSWGTGTTAKLACTACHGQGTTASQPTYPHPQNTTCSTCHAGSTSTTVTAATHVDAIVTRSTSGCTGCHGELGAANVLAAAPLKSAPGASGSGTNSYDTVGAVATTAVGVGAHEAHLVGNGAGNTPRWRSTAIACAECHVVPTSNTDVAHATGVGTGVARATLTFGALAGDNAFGARTPTYTQPGCASTYCHAPRADTVAGLNQAPSWIGAAATAQCGSCHGLPPLASGHTSSTACSGCHPGYADAPSTASTIAAVNALAHINGSLDVANMTCTSCHGAVGRTPVATAVWNDVNGQNLVKAAPPLDGSGVATGNLVGAHQAHVNQGDVAAPGPLSNALRCDNCHLGQVWTTAPHATPANPVLWGNIATAGGITPTAYSAASKTCSNTYCHGNFPGGKLANTVSWGTGTTAKLACTACHGQGTTASQPTYPHPQNTTCSTCHAGSTSTTVTAATHVDAIVTRSTSGCTGCHGELGAANVLAAAPLKSAPGASGSGTNSYDTVGAVATTAVGVGAHEAHLVGNGAGNTPRWRSTAIACAECHLVPTSNTDVAHATGVGTGVARATLTFGALAGDNAFETKAASYAQPTCSSTYCHDPKSTDTAAGQVNAPAWTGAASAAQCGSCHGLPPVTAAHPSDPLCGSCHPGYASSPTSASTIAAVNQLSHINGQLDGGGDCVTCHDEVQGTRRPIVPEFRNAWSHKRSSSGGVPANTVVTKWDCVVCHMEGDAATGNPSGVHRDGLINLRDPDTGLNIKGVTFGGTGAGAYASTATDATFTAFSRNLASATLEPAVQAIMINQCLKCHDGNGALSASARVPTTGTAEKPFGTTIAGAAYVGAGVTANGVAGGVADVNASFAPTNSSYHPVTGKQNNSYASGTRMVAPWSVDQDGRHHHRLGSAALLLGLPCAARESRGTITTTVTAHGGAVTLRGNATASGTAPSATTGATLCAVCHARLRHLRGRDQHVQLQRVTRPGFGIRLRLQQHHAGLPAVWLQQVSRQRLHDRGGAAGSRAGRPRGQRAAGFTGDRKTGTVGWNLDRFPGTGQRQALRLHPQHHGACRTTSPPQIGGSTLLPRTLQSGQSLRQHLGAARSATPPRPTRLGGAY